MITAADYLMLDNLLATNLLLLRRDTVLDLYPKLDAGTKEDNAEVAAAVYGVDMADVVDAGAAPPVPDTRGVPTPPRPILSPQPPPPPISPSIPVGSWLAPSSPAGRPFFP